MTPTGTPTVNPATAFARVSATGTFTQDGFTYERCSSQAWGPEDTACATLDATGAQWCITGEPGTPVTADNEWVLV